MTETRVLFAFLLLAAGYQLENRIRLPDATVGARCRFSLDGVVVDQSGHEIAVDCARQNQALQCDFDTAEPLDAALQDVCRAGSLTPRVAARVRVVVKRPAAVTVEWLDFPILTQPRVVAARRLPVGPSIVLAVADTPDRFVRFSRAGASPITLSAAELLAEREWPLPEPRQGGELIARLIQSRVRPVAYRLSGPSLFEQPAAAGLVRFDGIPPGAYELIPVYEGGISGRRRAVVVSDQRSSLLSLPAEPVGGAEILPDESICAHADSVILSRIAMGTAETTSDLVRTAMNGKCSSVFAGLTPGTYQVVFRSHRGHLGAERFAVAAQALSTVRVAGSLVNLSGRVLLNGKPQPDVHVTFSRSGTLDAQRVSATTDSSGAYEVGLTNPGIFDVTFRQGRLELLGNERHITVTPGDNVQDLVLEGGAVNVDIRAWDRTTPVQVSLSHVTMLKPGLTGDGFQLAPNDPLPVTVGGIAFGEYLVSARQHGASADSPDRIAASVVVLDARHPRADVELELKELHTVVEVVDSAQHVVEGVALWAKGTAVQPRDAGTFVLDDVEPGTYLLVAAPGFTPLCRRLPETPHLRIPLETGTPTNIEFRGERNLDVPPGLLVWPRSDCPVALAQFEFRRVTSADEATAFTVTNFPSGAGVAFVAGSFDAPDRYRPIQPGPDGVVHLTLPKPRLDPRAPRSRLPFAPLPPAVQQPPAEAVVDRIGR